MIIPNIWGKNVPNHQSVLFWGAFHRRNCENHRSWAEVNTQVNRISIGYPLPMNIKWWYALVIQCSYWKSLIVDFPIKDGDFPSLMLVYQRVNDGSPSYSRWIHGQVRAGLVLAEFPGRDFLVLSFRCTSPVYHDLPGGRRVCQTMVIYNIAKCSRGDGAWTIGLFTIDGVCVCEFKAASLWQFQIIMENGPHVWLSQGEGQNSINILF